MDGSTNLQHRNNKVYFLEAIASANQTINYTYDDEGRLTNYLIEREGDFSQKGTLLFAEANFNYKIETNVLESIRIVNTSSDPSVPESYDIFTYAYNEYGLLDTLLISEYSENNILESSSSYIYKYNSQEQLLSINECFKDVVSQFEFYQKFDIVYDSLSRVEQYIVYEKLSEQADFELVRTNTYTFEEKRMIHVSENSLEELIGTGEYIFDENYNLNSIYYATPDTSFELFVEYTYNKEISAEELIYPSSIRPSIPSNFNRYNSQLLMRTATDRNGELVPAQTSEYFWKEGNLETSIDESKFIDLFVYPNPASSRLNFRNLKIGETYDLNISNALGQKVVSTNLDAQSSNMNIASLSNGSYFYEIRNGKGMISKGMFIKQE